MRNLHYPCAGGLNNQLRICNSGVWGHVVDSGDGFECIVPTRPVQYQTQTLKYLI
jgi:hypothetical protein